MKKIYATLFSLFFLTNFFATDLVVNSSGQPGTYTTLSAALSAAASSGDRILIPSTITLIEDITINKSIDIIPQTQGNYFYLEGDINVTANAGLEIRILGMNFSGDLNCSSGTASASNMCHLYFIDCNVTDPGTTELSADVSGFGFHVLYCNLPDVNVKFRFGEIIASEIDGFHVAEGDNNNYNDTINIIANIINCNEGSITYTSSWPYGFTISGQSVFDTRDYYYNISNNYFYNTSSDPQSLIIANSDTLGSGSNILSNNTFYYPYNYTSLGQLAFPQYYTGSGTTIYWTRPNTKVINNLFLQNFHSSNAGFPAIGTSVGAYQPLDLIGEIKYNVFGYANSPNTATNDIVTFGPTNYQNYDVSLLSHFVIDDYNYYVDNSEYSSINTFRLSDGKLMSGMGMDKGFNSAQYYDLDMTRNDCGTYGGPYSMENYWNDSTATGKARIYHLDMPSEIWSGQTPTIKASAVHKK